MHFKNRLIKLSKDYNYDSLVNVYMKKDLEGNSIFKEKSIADASIAAHAAYHGMPLITFNRKDFSVSVNKKIKQENKNFFRDFKKEVDIVDISNFVIKPYLLDQFFIENGLCSNSKVSFDYSL